MAYFMQVPTGVNTEIAAGVGMCVKRRRDISAEFHAGSVSAAISCVLTLWYAPCPIEHKAPYVCNNCPKSISCLFDKYLYNADYAHKEYCETLRKSRQGIDMTRDELAALDSLVSPLIRKGQPLAHILAHHAEEIPCGERNAL